MLRVQTLLLRGILRKHVGAAHEHPPALPAAGPSAVPVSWYDCEAHSVFPFPMGLSFAVTKDKPTLRPSGLQKVDEASAEAATSDESAPALMGLVCVD